MAIDLSSAGIAALCGPAKAGEYAAKVTAVSTSIAPGGGKTWHLHWNCSRAPTPIVESLLTSVSGDRLAPALRRLADLLLANGKPLQFEHEGALIGALVGCRSMLTIAVNSWTGAPVVVPDEMWREKQGNGAGADPASSVDTPLSPAD